MAYPQSSPLRDLTEILAAAQDPNGLLYTVLAAPLAGELKDRKIKIGSLFTQISASQVDGVTKPPSGNDIVFQCYDDGGGDIVTTALLGNKASTLVLNTTADGNNFYHLVYWNDAAETTGYYHTVAFSNLGRLVHTTWTTPANAVALTWTIEPDNIVLAGNSGNAIFRWTLSGYQDMRLVAAPGSPTASDLRVYADTATGLLTVKNSAGVTRTVGISIGNTITSATQGSVLFAGASGVLAQDNASFFWDDGNNRLGLGTTSPERLLEVQASLSGIGGNGLIRIHNTSTTGFSAIEYERANVGDINLIIGYSNESTTYGSGAISITPNGHSYKWIITATEKLRLDSTGLGVNGAASGTEFSVLASATGELAEKLTSANGATVDLVEWILVADDTNSVANLLTRRANSNGTAATGFGQSTTYTLESSTTTNQTAAIETVLWTDATHASRTSNMAFSVVDSAVTVEAFRITPTAITPGMTDAGGDLGTAAVSWRQLFLDQTLTDAGTTGNQTIDKSAGSVNFAAAETAITVTCNKCTTSSIVICTVLTNDATGRLVSVVPGAGSFVITIVAPAAEMRVGFLVLNQ